MIYTTEMNGKNCMWEVDGSMVPAEWYDLQIVIELIQIMTKIWQLKESTLYQFSF